MDIVKVYQLLDSSSFKRILTSLSTYRLPWCCETGWISVWGSTALRSGMDRNMVTVGAGLQDDHWQVDVTLETHKELGNIYMLSFTVRN